MGIGKDDDDTILRKVDYSEVPRFTMVVTRTRLGLTEASRERFIDIEKYESVRDQLKLLRRLTHLAELFDGECWFTAVVTP